MLGLSLGFDARLTLGLDGPFFRGDWTVIPTTEAMILSESFFVCSTH